LQFEQIEQVFAVNGSRVRNSVKKLLSVRAFLVQEVSDHRASKLLNLDEFTISDLIRNEAVATESFRLFVVTMILNR
jgi:hypothetical protein